VTQDAKTPGEREQERLRRLADFLFEVGMLRKTQRTGYQFLGSGAENVAEHSFRTAVIGYTLAVMTERSERATADPYRTAMLCLFHDLHEARTGDFNYVYKRYNKSDPVRAITDALVGTGMRERILDLWDELEGCDTLASLLAQDADQIDLILNLKEELDLGNRYAAKWLEHAVKRLRTEEGRALTDQILKTDHTDWWFKVPDPAWWSQKNGKDRKGSLAARAAASSRIARGAEGIGSGCSPDPASDASLEPSEP
jgi:putative hydrolase of HD superfamily